jgi:hypothetical protein
MSTLHIVGINTNNQLIHTRSSAQWQSTFGNVQQAANNSPLTAQGTIVTFNPLDVTTLQYNGRLHVIALSEPPNSGGVTLPGIGNNIFYSYRKKNGNWRQFVDLGATVRTAFNLPNDTIFTRVACTNYRSTLFICVMTNQGRVVCLQKSDMNSSVEYWGGTNFPNDLNSNDPTVRDLTCFVANDCLNIGTIHNNGRLVRRRCLLILDMSNPKFYVLTLDRRNDSTIFVNGQNLPDPIAVSGSYVRGKEHFVVCTRTGGLLHHQSGQSFFGDINSVNGSLPIAYREVSCSELNGCLEIATVSTNGIPFHTRYKKRRNSWHWQGFMGDISRQSANSGNMTRISVS